MSQTSKVINKERLFFTIFHKNWVQASSQTRLLGQIALNFDRTHSITKCINKNSLT